MDKIRTLQKKVALVTGSSKGIGAGIALELAKAGADVCINYASSAVEANTLVDQIKSLGSNALAVSASFFEFLKADDVHHEVVCERFDTFSYV